MSILCVVVDGIRQLWKMLRWSTAEDVGSRRRLSSAIWEIYERPF